MVVTQMRNCASIAAESYRPKLKCLKKTALNPVECHKKNLARPEWFNPVHLLWIKFSRLFDQSNMILLITLECLRGCLRIRTFYNSPGDLKQTV